MAVHDLPNTAAEVEEALGFALNGSTKAWASYSSVDGSLKDSYNISSATFNSSGDVTLDYTNDFSAEPAYAGVAGNNVTLNDGNNTGQFRVVNRQLGSSSAEATGNSAVILVGTLA